MENHCNLIYEKSQANQLKSTVGHLYQSFSEVTNQLRSKDALTHNMDTVWLVQDCKSKKLYINIYGSLMYSDGNIISTPQNLR